jgi:hypothetical protein
MLHPASLACRQCRRFEAWRDSIPETDIPTSARPLLALTER